MGKSKKLKQRINLFLYDKQDVNQKIISMKKSFDEVNKLIGGNKK